MIQLKPLKNPLENRVTVLRVYRSISLELKDDIVEWSDLSQKINETYKQLGGPTLNKVNQQGIFNPSKYRFKVSEYPVEFIPIMVNIIKEHLNRIDG